MRRILFIVCSTGQDLAGYKLFQDYPYGQTENIEWEVMVGNPHAALFNVPFVKHALYSPALEPISTQYEDECLKIIESKASEFDEIIDIKMSPSINPTSWDDYVVVGHDCDHAHDLLKCVNSDDVCLIDKSHYAFFDQSVKAPILTVYYQKTFDVYSDYERILADFEQIIHGSPSAHTVKNIHSFVRAVTHEERRLMDLELLDGNPLESGDVVKLNLPKSETFTPFLIDRTGEKRHGQNGRYCIICRMDL